MPRSRPISVPVRVEYDCATCPAYCCTYSDIEVGLRDIARLAKHFGIAAEAVERRFTRRDAKEGVRHLRHREDEHFQTACVFLDRGKRRCSVYEARPRTCRIYPEASRCGYYDFLAFEREQQDDPSFIARTG